MTSNELEILQKATHILDAEGFRGVYGGLEFDVFMEAIKKVEKAIYIAKKHVEGEQI